MRRVWLAVLVLSSTAAAEELRPQVQIDGGLSVIGPAYEQPITSRIAIGVEAFVFGTYFLPWFDLGERVVGVGGGIRPTFFANASGRGLYVAPYLRVAIVDDDESGARGIGTTTGVFVGWAFGLSKSFDLRIGAGAQYIYLRTGMDAEREKTSTPFVALDAVIGYRL